MGEEGGARGSVLVVCTANVCRSPLAAAVLRGSLPGVRVGSAGVRALEGAPMCAVSATRLPASMTPPMHRARQLAPESVRGADLVLTMEREQRSSTVRLAPGSQATVFTLREAAALLDGLLERGQGPLPDLAAVAAALHGLRGTVPIPADEPPRRRFWQRPAEPEDPLTIVDGHGLDDREHEAAVDRVDDVARAVAERLARVLARG